MPPSAVDVRTEAGILDALRTVLQGRTTLIVARRQSTLALADRVALIAEGRVAAIGTHNELLASNADYRALVSTEIADDLSPEPAAVEREGDGIDLAAWPETAPVAGSAAPIAFTESVSAGGHSRSAIPANAALAAGRDDISAALARLPAPDANPGVDVAREINAREPFSLGRFLAPYRNGLLIGLLLVIVEAVLGVLVPLIIGRGIDAVVARSGSDVLIAALSLLGVGVAAWCNGMLLLRHTARTAERLLFALRIRILAQFHRLPLERYEAEESGRLMARATTDVESLATLFQQGLLNAVVGLATCAGILVGLALLEPRLALVLLPLLPILILATEWYRRASAKAYEQSRQHVAAVYASIQEGVTAGRATRALAGESVAAEAFGKRSSAYKHARERASRISAIYFPSLQMLSSISKALVLLVGSGFVASGQMAVGVLVTFLLYVEQFFAPIQQLSQVFDQWMQAGTALRRIDDLLGEPVPRARQTDDASSTVPGAGTLTLADVSFSYPGTEARALRHIDLDIAPGTKLAVVGTTGAGKSTLARLVTGLTPPSAGTIALDGRDIVTIPGPVLHRAIAYVPQEPILFGRSVADNIAYGRPDATPAQIEAAARAVGAHAFIATLPHGYRSILAEGGRSLAAGQRQLLCLARALLVEPRILVLDEATSRLDLAVEAAIERVLAADPARTTIIIAHRLQTVRHADIVVVLEAGEIVEIGKPADLLASKGWFARLHGLATPSAQSQSDISAAESAPAGVHAS
jgi:ATP-binding cassette subfamily B protein